MSTPYMTLKETAKYLKLSEITIYRMIQRGDLPAVKLGRSWRIHKDVLEDYLQKMTFPIRPPEPDDVANNMLHLLEREIDRLVSSAEPQLLRKSS